MSLLNRFYANVIRSCGVTQLQLTRLFGRRHAYDLFYEYIRN